MTSVVSSQHAGRPHPAVKDSEVRISTALAWSVNGIKKCEASVSVGMEVELDYLHGVGD